MAQGRRYRWAVNDCFFFLFFFDSASFVLSLDVQGAFHHTIIIMIAMMCFLLLIVPLVLRWDPNACRNSKSILVASPSNHCHYQYNGLRRMLELVQ